MDHLMAVVCGFLVAAAGLLVLLETWYFLRCRLFRWCPHHQNVGLIGEVVEPLAAGCAQADFERCDRKGRPLSDEQKAHHLRAVRGRMRKAIELYIGKFSGRGAK